MATAKTETVVTSVTLTLSIAEAEAVLVLTGCVAGGRRGDGGHRDTSDGVHNVLCSALDTFAIHTDFYRAMEPGSRTVSLR